MKILNTIYSLLFLVFCFALLSNCKKQKALPEALLIVETGDVFQINSRSATVTGAIISDGGSAIIARGICWSNLHPPTISDNKTFDGTGIGSFTAHVSGLSLDSTYFFRAYGTNSAGTSYGQAKTVTIIPIGSSLYANLKETGTNYVEFSVEVTSDGGSQVTDCGICWSSTNMTPTISDNKTTNGAGPGSFTTRISNLDPYTTYYFRAYATNEYLTTYATMYNRVRFAPEVHTKIVMPVTPTTARVDGSIDLAGVGPITSQGICWSTTPQPTIADNKTEECNQFGLSFYNQCTINGLTPNTAYYLRAFATNIAGTSYGNEYSFALEQFDGPTVSDVDGNLYHTVTIGTQVWMVENLRTTSYRNGEPIPNVTDNDKWYNLSSGAYCNYLNDPQNPDYYGKLYNWYAVVDSRNIAPAGWHVPDENEFTILIDFLKNNGYGDVGKSLASKSAWSYDEKAVITDLAKNNSSGFTAFPAGTRGYHGTDFLSHFPINSASFTINGFTGTWWTVSELYGNMRFLSLNLFTPPMPPGYSPSIPIGLNIGSSKFRMDGFSVRCIKD